MNRVSRSSVAHVDVEGRRVEALWSVARGRRLYVFEVGSGKTGWELQILRDGEYIYRHRHPTRSAAIVEAEDWRRRFEQRGWRVRAG